MVENTLTAHKASYRALAWRELGFMPIPCAPQSKTPLRKWKPYAHKMASPNKVLGLFQLLDQEAEIALIMGHQFEDGTYILVIDYDDQESFEKAAQTWAGKTLIVKSHRGGHIYFRSREAAQTTKTPTGEIRGVNSYVMSPFSRHAKGGFYEPHQSSSDPHNGKEAIHLLTQEEEQFLKILPFTGHRIHITKKARKILNGILLDDNKEGSKSYQEHGIVVYFLSHYPGISLEEVKELFDKLAQPNTHYAQHSDKQAWITNAYYNAQKWLSQNHRTAFQETLESLYQYMQHVKWNWRGGGTERVVYKSFLDLADKAGTLDNLHFSITDICIANGLSSKDTALEAVKRLLDKNLLILVKKGTWNKANLYSINPNPDVLIKSLKPKTNYYLSIKTGYWNDIKRTLESQTPVVSMGSLCNPDLTIGIAGRNRALFFEKLSFDYQEIATVRDAIGLSRTSFKRHLDWFIANGLASLENGRIKLIEVSKDFLQALAKKLGVLGKFKLRATYFVKRKLERLKNLAQRGRNKVVEELFNRVTGESLVYCVGL